MLRKAFESVETLEQINEETLLASYTKDELAKLCGQR